MQPFELSKQAARRYVLGRQGLWPGRRWSSPGDLAKALRAIEAVQLDPLSVVARSHDIVLWSRLEGYLPEHLNDLLYTRREAFDYGGVLFVYPMEELPYWRLPMDRRRAAPRWEALRAGGQTLLDEVRTELHRKGPLGSRHFSGNHTVQGNYRGSKDTSLALYYLWLTGELLIHHREGTARIYDFRQNIVPPGIDREADHQEAEDFFARKAVAFQGIIRELAWKNAVSGYIQRKLTPAEARAWLDELVDEEVLVPVRLEGSKDRWFALKSDLADLETVAGGDVPPAWKPLGNTPSTEAVLLAPLDIVSARGRASWLFDFEYVWEVYKPVATRRWGYYTLPVLYGDQLVARLDPRLDRKTGVLHILGFWPEDAILSQDTGFTEGFPAALARGLARFAGFLSASIVDFSALEPTPLLEGVSTEMEQASSGRFIVRPATVPRPGGRS